MKVKILRNTDEDEINEFISDKDIVTITYHTQTTGYYDVCFITYNDKEEGNEPNNTSSNLIAYCERDSHSISNLSNRYLFE